VVGFVVVGIVRSCDVTEVNTAISKAFDFDTSALTLSGSGEVLAGPGDRTDVVMVLQDTKDSTVTRRVARISFTGSASKLVWQSEPLDESTSRVEVAVAGDTLFAGTEDQLYALDAATGTTTWQTTLRDKVTVGCEDCFAAVQGRLVVRTADAYVTAFGTRSAESLWSKRLVSTSGSISVVGDRLFVVDDPEDPSGLTPVAMVDPANGRTIRSTTPQCPKSGSTPWDLELSAGDQIRPVPGSTEVMAVFGFGDGCVVRWNPDTGVIRWSSRLTGLGSVDDGSIVVGRLDLVLANSGGQLVTVYLPNGKARVLEGAGDLQAHPSAIVDRTLVALTVTTRGTPRGGLAGWDLSTGERLWANASLGTAQPVEVSAYHSSDALFDGTPRSLVVPAGKGLNVFTFEGTERTFTVAPIDLATGELGTEVRRGFLSRYDSGTPSLTVEGQHGDRLIVSIENLLQSIPVSGRGPLVSYPEKN
jgi:outer membrane protein assembly factor BamB